MQNVIMGGNANLPAERFDVLVDWPGNVGVLDLSAYLVGASGKVRSDDDMIFYNQPADPNGSVKITAMESSKTRVAVDLGLVANDVSRIIVCVTIENTGLTMAAFRGVSATIVVDGKPALGFQPELTNAPEVAMRLVELYRRGNIWKFRADGQGFSEGLAPLARSFGMDIAEDEQAPPHEAGTALAAPRTQAPGVSPFVQSPADLVSAPLPSPVRRDDGSTALSAARPSASWHSSDFGEIAVRLTWSSQSGGLQGRPRPLELGLGCFYELQDGRKGLVQSWDTNGQFDAAPYVHLTAAEISGAGTEQKLRINGERWPLIRKLTVFAFLQSGAPGWRTASLSLAISTSGETPVSLQITEGPDGNAMLGLVSLDNRDSEIEIGRLARYAVGHQELDQELGWELRWKTRYA